MAKAKKLPSGSYRVQVYVGKDATGKRLYESFTADKAKEAEYMALEFQLKRKSMNRPENMTVSDAIDRYIEMKDGVLSPSSIATYKKIKRNNLQDLMHIKLIKLTQEIIQKSINNESKLHAPKTVSSVHGLLSAVLREYYPDLVLRTRLPQKIKYIPSIPTTEEITEIM